jgi:hypothetical protein
MAMRDIDTIIAAATAKHPRLTVEQLKVKHPGADDDGIWFFNHPESEFEVQLESSYGTFPFLVGTDRHDERGEASTVDEAIVLIESWLGLATAG